MDQIENAYLSFFEHSVMAAHKVNMFLLTLWADTYLT